MSVRNLEKAKAWYEHKLGFRAAHVGKSERLVVFDVGAETSFTIWELKAGKKLVSATTVGSYPIFCTKDIASSHKQLKERGVDAGPIQGGQRSVH